MFTKIAIISLLVFQVNSQELEVTNKGIKSNISKKLINTSIKNSSSTSHYWIEEKSFEDSNFILYKETYLNSSKEQCLIPIYKDKMFYRLTKAYCFDFIISHKRNTRIPVFYIYNLDNMYLHNLSIYLPNFSDALSNHPYKRKSIYDKEKNELIFPNLISYAPHYNAMSETNLTCLVPGDSFENSNFEKFICRKKISLSLSKIEKTLKQKKDLKTYNKEFFQNLLPEKPIEKENLTTYNNIAYYLQKAGANEEAIYLLEKILEKYPNRTVAHYNLADAYWALGEKKKAIASYTTYIEQMKEKGKEKRIPQVVRDRVSSK